MDDSKKCCYSKYDVYNSIDMMLRGGPHTSEFNIRQCYNCLGCFNINYMFLEVISFVGCWRCVNKCTKKE